MQKIMVMMSLCAGGALVIAPSAMVAAATTIAAAASTAPTGGSSDEGLAEIVVTAEKRSESAQRVPLAVTSISAETLSAAHVTGADDLPRVFPDVQVDVGGAVGDPGGANALFTIRGLGASSSGPEGSPGVAVHVDGVFRQNGLSSNEFYDLQRVEVDPGPQGTLYGRSAAAGAVNVIPNFPTQEFAANATVEAGNYGAVRTEAMLNLPIDSILAVRGAFQTIKHDGYFSNGYDDENDQAGRLQALLIPSDALSIRLYGDYVHIGGRGTSDVFVGGPGLPALQALLPQLNDGNIRDRSIAQYCTLQGQLVGSCLQRVAITKWSTHIDATYNFGWATLTVLPAFSASTMKAQNENSPLPISNYNQLPFDQNQTSVEIRLSDSGESQLKWVAGANYFHNHVLNVNIQDVNLLTPLPTPVGLIPGVVSIAAADYGDDVQQSYAAFGQFTYPVLEGLRVTGGARYNHDTASSSGELATNSQEIYVLNGPLIAAPVTAPITSGPVSASTSFNDVTYRVAVDADVGPNSIVYASVGTGYKPGGLNEGGPPSLNTPGQLAALSAQFGLSPAQLAALAPSQTFGPEKVTHFEVGSKNRFFNNRLEINDTLYYDNYKNYQNGTAAVANPLAYLSQGFVVTNAGASRVYGDELAVKYALTNNDLVTVAVNYLRAYFSSYRAAPYLTPNGAVPASDFSGKPLPNAPLFSSNIGYTHTFNLPDGGKLDASLFTHLSDGYWVYFAETPGTYQPHYSSSTADLTWRSASDRWSVTAFGKNLENKNIESFGEFSAAYTAVHLNAPRTYGLSATVKVP